MLDPLIGIRVLHFASSMMLAGSIVFLGFVAGPALRAGDKYGRLAPIRSRLAAIIWGSLVVAVITGAAWLVFRAAQMGDDLTLGEALSQGVVSTVLTDTDFGHTWLARLAVAGLLALVLIPVGRGSSWALVVAIVLSIALVGTLAWGGHAAGTAGAAGNVHLVADVLHLIAAAAWVGALIPLALLLGAAGAEGSAGSFAVAREAVVRFSKLGVMSVGILLMSGIVNIWMLTGSLPALTGTDYGHLLIVKIALFVVMLSAAAVNRLWLTPRLLESGSPAIARDALRQIGRNSLIEVVLASIIIVIVAALGTMAPGGAE